MSIPRDGWQGLCLYMCWGLGVNWKLVKQIRDGAIGGGGGGDGVIDLISCARRPIEGCRFSRFRPLYLQHLLGRFILGGKG